MTSWFPVDNILPRELERAVSPRWPNWLLPIAFCLLPLAASAQTKPYFQQEVNYNIQVALDDRMQILTGSIEMEYINHSPDALPEIWLHLWGNAFKNRRTAFAQQKLRHADGRFYFASDSTLGFYKKLDFAVNGQQATWKFDPANPDIAVVTLAEPLAPGARLRLSTPFELHIPASFSRLGHVGESYQITQWYPKPAVYDNRGWHAMPYLDQGEFYSEFGNYDVSITLPENYVVGATGMLQNPSELAFLVKKEAESREKLRSKIDPKEDPFPPSSATQKTLRYHAERVHDFAWFADKRFLVLRDTARLASGRTVDCWAMFTNSNAELWKKGAFYVRRSIEFYSDKVGDYPWPQATAVHSALSAGGGMEYPMITVINDEASAKSLDEVITHEVGHNWFYGVLASNERDHPFLDEGFNSYYEQRYMRQYWGGGDLSDDNFHAPKWLFKPKEQGSLIELGYDMLAREHVATPPDSPSDDFQPLAYGLDVYMKTALCMAWLEKSSGLAKFDAAMHDYFRQWQFRHPYPEDVQAVLEKSGLDAGWFFQSMQTEKQADFALLDLRAANGAWDLDVENKGELPAPFSVTALQHGQPVTTQWYPAATGAKQTIHFPATPADAFVIDYEHTTLDINRKNNNRRTGGLLPGLEPLRFKLFQPVENPAKTVFALTPWLGWNNYDKVILGGVLYNAPFPPRKFQYYLAPAYAFGSKQWVGLVDLRYKIFPGGLFPKITLGMGAKTFDFDYNFTDRYYSRYYRFVPQIRAELANGGSVNFRHFLNFRTLLIGREEGVYDAGLFTGKKWVKSTIYELRYEAVQERLPNPYRFVATLESQPDYRNRFDQPGKYLKGSLEWKQAFYYQPKRKVTARAFAGYFLQNTERHRGVELVAFALNPQGFNDYRFDEVFFGRSDEQGFRSRQLSQTQGGFKSAFGSSFAGIIGNSNNYLLALNLKADLPARLPWGIPLVPWFDVGYFDDATPIGTDRPASEQLVWSGGLMLEFLKGNLEIYFPLLNSKTLKDRYIEQSGGKNSSAIFGGGNYLKWISFSANISKLDPNRLLEEVAR